MKIISALYLFLILFCTISCSSQNQNNEMEKTNIRFATYNVAMYRGEANHLAKDLSNSQDTQIQNIAAVIQHIRPDVIALMEFDYDSTGTLLDAFQKNYLSKSQQGEETITYPYSMSFPSNTGLLSDFDFNNDGAISLPEDAYGYGRYEGQYAFAVFSKYPIDEKNIRSFQHFKWADMPDAKRPMNEDGSFYYDDEEWASFRLSSKNHIDIPVLISKEKSVHVILAHPTPPVFDGPEDRNGLRNFDEIRLIKDYISNADYLLDDNGQKGGLQAGESFVIMGDFNADPHDGDAYPDAIQQLLSHPSVHPDVASGKHIPKSNGGKIFNKSTEHKGDPAFDTSFFGLRIDYVLPSADLKIKKSGVCWPAPGEALYEQVKDQNASDHLLVWVDIQIP